MIESGCLAEACLQQTISVIVAAKNSLPDLQRLVGSFREIGSLRTELVIVDGAGNDGTSEWLASLTARAESPRIVSISQSDSGIAEAWNRGVRLARGRWLVFLGADDRLGSADAWRAVVDRLESLPPRCGVAAFPVRIVTPGGVILAEEVPRLGAGGGQFPAVNAIPHQGAFHRRSLWEAHGDFDTLFAIAADYEFLLRMWSAGVEIQACEGPPPVAMTFGGASKRSPLVNVREFGRARRLHGVRVSPLNQGREWVFAAIRSGLAAVLGESVTRRLADLGRRIRGLPPVWSVP